MYFYKGLFRFSVLLLVLSLSASFVFAQLPGGLSGGGLNNTGQSTNTNGTDSAGAKRNNAWKEEPANIHFNTINSTKERTIDSSLEDFYNYQPRQTWRLKDLGNANTALQNPFFTPFMPMGLSLGYHIYDGYFGLNLDSLRLYNTTRPYSSFQYMLGTKKQQRVAIMHTQNITPDWNFAFNVKYNSSPGFYKNQYANNIGGSFSTNYLSKNKRYAVVAGFIYNRAQQDENGGVTDTTQLTNPAITSKDQITVNIPSSSSSSTRSAVMNQEGRMDFYIQNNYSFGKTDTLYNSDSTRMNLEFTPRFRIKHQLSLHSDNHVFQDKRPQSARYSFIEPSLVFSGNDSIYSAQKWFYVDNKFSLNGFIGNLKHLVNIEAGVGNRVDNFSTNYIYGKDKFSSVSNYLFGEIKKEATDAGQWEYRANAQLFLTGDAVGSFDLNGSIGKDLGKWGNFSGGFHQNLSNPAYTYTTMKSNRYDYFTNTDFNKMSITHLWAKTVIDKIKLELGANNYLITNYIYYNETLKPQQQSEAFSVLQIYGRKNFSWHIFRWDNEIAWQQATGGAPVNLPSLLIREKLGIATPLFKSALIVAAGVEARYHTAYYSDGYTPYFNQYYLQNSVKVTNVPELAAYFNFKIKSFRAFLLFDQVQQMFTNNVINTPYYPGPSFMFRFGFNWILVN